MEDIRRRLDLGRAGPKVRGVEDGVIASLDKLIDKLEEQQQAAAAAAAAAAKKSGRGGAMPNAPLPDSRPMELKGPGEVAKRDIGDGSGWGNLPPRERDEALQQIGKDFPAHYRDVIEQYFRNWPPTTAKSPTVRAGALRRNTAYKTRPTHAQHSRTPDGPGRRTPVRRAHARRPFCDGPAGRARRRAARDRKRPTGERRSSWARWRPPRAVGAVPPQPAARRRCWWSWLMVHGYR